MVVDDEKREAVSQGLKTSVIKYLRDGNTRVYSS